MCKSIDRYYKIKELMQQSTLNKSDATKLIDALYYS